MTIIFIIYVILSGTAMAGVDVWNEFKTNIRIIFCFLFGWISFPLFIAFVFGKYINNVNDRY